MTSLPWLLVAVAREHSQFRPKVAETLRSAPTLIQRCVLGEREFLLVETGVGGNSVRATLDHARTLSTPTTVFMAGFAGALDPALQVGDAILASTVVDPAGIQRSATWIPSLPHRPGTLLTHDRLIADPKEKAELANQFSAVTVDMETAHVAEWCERHNVAWGCVRVVSDDARTPVSKDVFDLLENGRVALWPLLTTIARRPAILNELLSLGRSTHAAAKTIAATLTAVLQSEIRVVT